MELARSGVAEAIQLDYAAWGLRTSSAVLREILVKHLPTEAGVNAAEALDDNHDYILVVGRFETLPDISVPAGQD